MLLDISATRFKRNPKLVAFHDSLKSEKMQCLGPEMVPHLQLTMSQLHQELFGQKNLTTLNKYTDLARKVGVYTGKDSIPTFFKKHDECTTIHISSEYFAVMKSSKFPKETLPVGIALPDSGNAYDDFWYCPKAIISFINARNEERKSLNIVEDPKLLQTYTGKIKTVINKIPPAKLTPQDYRLLVNYLMKVEFEPSIAGAWTDPTTGRPFKSSTLYYIVKAYLLLASAPGNMGLASHPIWTSPIAIEPYLSKNVVCQNRIKPNKSKFNPYPSLPVKTNLKETI